MRSSSVLARFDSSLTPSQRQHPMKIGSELRKMIGLMNRHYIKQILPSAYYSLVILVIASGGKSVHNRPSLISSHRPGPPRPQELRSDAAPARAVASTSTSPTILLAHLPGLYTSLPAQKQMNRLLLSRPSPLLRSLSRAPIFHRATARMDYSSVPTPERCYADFCLVPVRRYAPTHRPYALQQQFFKALIRYTTAKD